MLFCAVTFMCGYVRIYLPASILCLPSSVQCLFYYTLKISWLLPCLHETSHCSSSEMSKTSRSASDAICSKANPRQERPLSKNWMCVRTTNEIKDIFVIQTCSGENKKYAGEKISGKGSDSDEKVLFLVGIELESGTLERTSLLTKQTTSQEAHLLELCIPE